MSPIKALTPAQRACRFPYQKRWQQAMAMAPSLPQSQVMEAIARLYHWMGLPSPQIHFCASPLVVFQHLARQPKTSQYEQFISQVLTYLDRQLRQQVYPELASIICWGNPFSPTAEENLEDMAIPDFWIDFHGMDIVRKALERGLCSPKTNPNYADIASGWLSHCAQTERWAWEACWIDFCLSELGCVVDQERWDVLQILVQGAGWIFPFDTECWVCDRPQLNGDRQGQLHNEAEAAITYGDGWKLYFWHGYPLPANYGSVLPTQWQASWYQQEADPKLRQILLEQIPSSQWQANWYESETEVQLREVLLEGIPPDQWKPQWLLSEPNSHLRQQILFALPSERLVRELHPKEIDAWGTYHLLRIDLGAADDSSPWDEEVLAELMKQPAATDNLWVLQWLQERWACFLTMTCPSTGHEHILQVPPTMQSAREAIRWVNWDIDAEEFAIQT